MGGGGGGGGSGTEHTGRNLQDGLFQIASQACHILVQVSWIASEDEYAETSASNDVGTRLR